jgi:hypothetical protein
MNQLRHDHDHDHDYDRNAVPAVTGGGAVASLESLGAILNRVDTSTAGGRSGLPMLQFKRDGNGTWQYGQRATVVEEGSRWAIDPRSFRWGYIAFDANNKVAGERLVPVSQPMPEFAELPSKGAKWTEQWAVTMKCVDGADAGAEVVYKPTTTGGIQAITGLVDAIRDRINSGQHGGAVAPIVLLQRDSYPHSQYGKVWVPVLGIADWMAVDGHPPAAAKPLPAPAPDQPRRRRVS